MIGRFLTTREALDFLEGTIASMLEERGKATESGALTSVIGYLRSVMLYSPFAESLADAPTWETQHDVEAWRNDGYARELDTYRLGEPRTFDTTVPEDRRTAIERRIGTFGDHPAGLGKFTRTMFANDLRRSLTPTRPRRTGDPARS
jgi:hypothetical protein